MRRIGYAVMAFGVAGGAWADVPGAAAPKPASPAERGAYVAGIAGCAGCHTPWNMATKSRDESKLYAGQLPPPGDKARGGTPNITPDKRTGIGKWTDAQIIAAVREGKRPDGARLSAHMPSAAYHVMTDDDAKALVAFLRTVKPVRNRIPRAKPEPGAPPPPDLPPAAGNSDPADDPVKHGEYLSSLLRCKGCHTPHEGPLKDAAYAGGNEFKTSWGPDAKAVYSSNLTGDPETGLGKWTAAQVADAVRELKRPDGTRILGPMNFHKDDYGLLADADAAALGAYIKALPPVKNKIPVAPPAEPPKPAM